MNSNPTHWRSQRMLKAGALLLSERAMSEYIDGLWAVVHGGRDGHSEAGAANQEANWRRIVATFDRPIWC